MIKILSGCLIFSCIISFTIKLYVILVIGTQTFDVTHAKSNSNWSCNPSQNQILGSKFYFPCSNMFSKSFALEQELITNEKEGEET